MFLELIIGVAVLTLIIVVFGPSLWSSRLSLTEDQKQWEKQGGKPPKSDA